MDADEAIVLGASLHAANLSDGIKLNRKLGMVDGSMYGFVYELDGPDLTKGESTKQLIVPRLKKLPVKVNHVASSVSTSITSHRLKAYNSIHIIYFY